MPQGALSARSGPVRQPREVPRQCAAPADGPRAVSRRPGRSAPGRPRCSSSVRPGQNSAVGSPRLSSCALAAPSAHTGRPRWVKVDPPTAVVRTGEEDPDHTVTPGRTWSEADFRIRRRMGDAQLDQRGPRTGEEPKCACMVVHLAVPRTHRNVPDRRSGSPTLTRGLTREGELILRRGRQEADGFQPRAPWF